MLYFFGAINLNHLSPYLSQSNRPGAVSTHLIFSLREQITNCRFYEIYLFFYHLPLSTLWKSLYKFSYNRQECEYGIVLNSRLALSYFLLKFPFCTTYFRMTANFQLMFVINGKWKYLYRNIFIEFILYSNGLWNVL